jgi:hypothetical protein
MANKAKVLLGTCMVALSLCVAIPLRMNRYYQKEYFGRVMALWNSEEAFIFVQAGTSVEKVPIWQQLLAKYWGTWGLPKERHTRTDVTTFHLIGRSLNKYRQEYFDITGQVYPINGTLYLIRGGYEISGFKWERGRFVKISPENLSEIRVLLKADEKSLAEPGWHKLDWEELRPFNDNYDKVFTFKPDQQNTSLHIKTTPATYDHEGYLAHNPHVEVVLSVDGIQHVLLDLNQDYRRISAKEFQKIALQQ